MFFKDFSFGSSVTELFGGGPTTSTTENPIPVSRPQRVKASSSSNIRHQPLPERQTTLQPRVRTIKYPNSAVPAARSDAVNRLTVLRERLTERNKSNPGLGVTSHTPTGHAPGDPSSLPEGESFLKAFKASSDLSQVKKKWPNEVKSRISQKTWAEFCDANFDGGYEALTKFNFGLPKG